MFEYRQVLLRLRAGDSDRDIARTRLMGRQKLALLRAKAQELGWLDPGQDPPDELTVAAAADRLVARHTCGAQSTVVLEASRLKLSSHLVWASRFGSRDNGACFR